MIVLMREPALEHITNQKRAARIRRVVGILLDKGKPLEGGAQAQLARHFGVSRQAIHRIVQRTRTDRDRPGFLRNNAPAVSGEQLAHDLMRERDAGQ